MLIGDWGWMVCIFLSIDEEDKGRLERAFDMEELLGASKVYVVIEL